MDKKQVITKLIERVIFLLAGIQVFWGVVWIACNITVVSRFAESDLLLQASRDFVLDEYMGILYPLLLRITSVAGGGYCVLVYLLQLGVAFVAYSYFLKKVFGTFFAKKHKISVYLMAAYIVTFPVILQGHMSVLPYSLASSMLVLVLAQLKLLLAEEGAMSAKSVISVGVFWVIAALLLPDYGIILGVVVSLGFMICGWKKERRWRVLLLTLFVAVACMGSVLSLTQTPGSLGRIQKSAGAVMLSRFAWPYMERNSFFWSEEVKATFDNTDFVQISLYPERIMYEFGPRLEETVGKEKADSLYWQMAIDSVKIGKKEALSALGRDLLLNVSGPVGIQLQWQGVGVSYAGWNYDRLAENAPIITRYYVNYAVYSFDFMALLGIVMILLYRKTCKEVYNRKICILTIFLIGIITIWYTLIGNGMQDYLKVIPLNILWCLLPVWGYGLCLKQDDTK